MNTQNKKYYKAVNPIYATFKGGYGEMDEAMTRWGYYCLWGHLRFCYSETDLIDGWKHISLHGYRNGYTYTPVKKLLWDFDWHFAYNKKFPFIKIGFKNIENLYKENFNWCFPFNKRSSVIKNIKNKEL